MMYGNGYFKNVISAGDVEANYSSDINLKTDLQQMENALEVVKKINGYMFKWKTDDEKNGKQDLGVIAQEVQKELPFLVTKNGNGNLAKVSIVNSLATRSNKGTQCQSRRTGE